MKVFVTGGTGFIGSRVVKNLLENTSHELMVLVMESDDIKSFPFLNDDRIKLVRGNLTNIDEWGKKLIDWQPDSVINLAWEGIPRYDPELSLRNFNMCFSLIKLVCLTTCKKFIGAGSCWEYGQKVGVLNEDSTLMYRDTFTSVKNSLHWLGRSTLEHHGIIFIWPRFFYVYGVGQKSASLIPTLINSINNNQKPNIKTPDAQNDFIYVDDIATGVVTLLDKCDTSGVYNIGTGKPTSIREIINIVYEELGLKKVEVVAGISQEKVCFYADNSKIKALGWNYNYSVRDGIKATLKDQGLIK